MVNLIDGDMVHYSVGWSIGDGDVEDAYLKVDSFISSIEQATGCTDSRLFIQGEGNYRKDILPEYKGNRKGRPKPKHHKAIREYIINHHNAFVVNGEEVDDKLGYEQTVETIICSADKDLHCIPGLHYNWSKKYIEFGVHSVTVTEADRFFYTQCLSGDATDNIPGLKRLKNRVATKKIKTPLLSMVTAEEMFNYIHSVYGDDSWYSSASCLWIRRKEHQMWEDTTIEFRGGQPEAEEQCDECTEKVVVEKPEEEIDS